MGSRNEFVYGAASVIIVLLSLTSCTSGGSQKPSSSDSDHSTTAVTSADAQSSPTFSLPAALAAATDVGPGEKLLFQKSSQKEPATYGPVATEAKTVVYLRCAGSGSVNFSMKEVGSFPMPCEEDGVAHGTRNVFDTRSAKNPTFSVSSRPGQIWSIGIYSEPMP